MKGIFKKNNREAGFIKITILIIVGLVVLKYAYNIDVINYAIQIWEKYGDNLQEIWNKIIIFSKNIFNKYI